MAKKSAPGNAALLLAALAFAFAIYLLIWGNEHSSSDRNLALVSGAVAIVLLILGVLRRYQPRSEGHPSPPER